MIQKPDEKITKIESQIVRIWIGIPSVVNEDIQQICEHIPQIVEHVLQEDVRCEKGGVVDVGSV